MQELVEIQQHLEEVKPGQPTCFTTACSPGDTIRQGDLYLIVIDKIPPGYNKVRNPTEKDLQLVIGNTVGARHCLDSLDGVVLFHPKVWGEESLEGPCIRFLEERKIVHRPGDRVGHGTVTVPAGLMIQCCYQREYDKELQKERRAKD